MSKILIIGGSGFLGSNLFKSTELDIIKTYNNNVIFGGDKFDITNDSIENIITNHGKIKRVVILAGVFNFKIINNDPDFANFVNVSCIKNIINYLISKNIFFSFISSESVFDGEAGNYKEFDIPSPIFPYAKQKVEIEEYIQKNTNNYQIIRVSKIFDSDFYRNTLVIDWIKKLNSGEDIHCANDNIFSPIHISDLCLIIESLVTNMNKGIFHACGVESLNRKEMLEYVIDKFNTEKKYDGNILYQSLKKFKGAEKQPLNTSLNFSYTLGVTKIKPNSFNYWVDSIISKFWNLDKI